MKKIVYLICLIVLGAVGYAAYFLNEAMPIATGYSAKYICSQVFLADRDPDVVFDNDIKPTNPLFAMVKNNVNREDKTVTSKGFGFLQPATAVYREGFGCTLAIDTTVDELMAQARGALPQSEPNPNLNWPDGEAVDFSNIPGEINQKKLTKTIEAAFQEPGPDTKRNTQAIVVVYKGKIIAEEYGPQFSRQTPMLGWSMSKSVTNALVGLLVMDNKLDIMDPAPVDAWKSPDDPRGKITLDQMLRMSSGLDFEEVYAPLKDATNMLYNSKSMAEFAALSPLRTAPDGEWYYSSGTTNMIARIVRDKTGGTLAGFNNFARTRLFDRIGMVTAIIEPDASGSFVGSSYMFASARDWARFGLLIQNDGIWGTDRLLPKGWVRYSTTPTPLAPQGNYGAQFWLNAGTKGNPKDRKFPSLPPDMSYLNGFNQQITAIIPSRDVVVVRLGVTHDDSWSSETFIRGVLDCITD